MTLVLDASVTLAWAFEDEGDAASESLLARLTDEEAEVPSVWPLEVGNALLAAERRGRIGQGEVRRFLGLLDALQIQVDRTAARRPPDTWVDLARQHELSTYDAAYLELAMRTGSSLATSDAGLRRAAEEVGAPLVGAPAVG